MNWDRGVLILAVFALWSACGPATAADAEQPATESKAAADWPLSRGNAQSTGYSPQTLPQDLQVRWEYKADEAIETTPVVADGLVYVSDVFGKLYAIDLGTGKQRWQKDFETGFVASPAVSAGLLVIGDVEGNLYGLDAKSGQERWSQQTDGEINGSATFFKENVLVTSQDGKLYCYRCKDGSAVWTYQTDDQIRCTPTIAGDRTFLGGCDGQLHMVDLNTGMAIGTPLPLGGPTGSTPAVQDKYAFLPIMDGAVLAFDWKEGKELWQYVDEERPQEYRGSAAVSDKLVVVSSQFKQVDAISIETGKRVWRQTLTRRADASPLIAGEDVWIAASDGRLIRLALADGTKRWEFEIRGSFLAAPAVSGDQLILGDDDGVVRCFAPQSK